MYIIEINGKEYKAIEKWEDMFCFQAVELQKVINKDCPEKLKNLYEAYGLKKDEQDKAIKKVYKTMTNEDLIKIFPIFYGKVIKLLTNVEQKVINKIQSEDRLTFYQKYCLPFVIGIYSNFPTDFKPKGIKFFEFEGEKYLLPVGEKKLGIDIPMVNLSALEFTETADLQIFAKDLEGGQFERANNIISILCRPAGEKYDEKICLERAEKFKNLTMDIVWEVFFCIMKCSVILNQNMLISLLRQQLREQKQEPKVA